MNYVKQVVKCDIFLQTEPNQAIKNISKDVGESMLIHCAWISINSLSLCLGLPTILWFAFVSSVLHPIQLQGKLKTYIITCLFHHLLPQTDRQIWFVRFLSETDTTQQGLDQNSVCAFVRQKGEQSNELLADFLLNIASWLSIYSFPFPFHPPLSDSWMWGLKTQGQTQGQRLELMLGLITFSRHHWQACCSSSRAINLVLPITVLPFLLLPPPPSCPPPPRPLCSPSLQQ